MPCRGSAVMTSISTPPHLRLVGVSETGPEQQVRQAVTAENRVAADNPDLDPTDPRWVLAVRAYTQLQGSALTFDRRERLMRTARTMGVRPFDAGMIIAIVQDRARRGGSLSDAAGTVAMLEPPARRRDTEVVVLSWIAAVASALVATTLAIWWLIG